MEHYEQLIFRNATVFDGEAFIGAHDVLVQDGRIVSISSSGSGAAAEREIDASGRWLCPGFIDLHCHLRDPGQTWKGDIVSETRAAAAGGFTTVVCMPNTQPAIDTPSIAEYVREKALREGLARVSPAGALTRGRGGEQLAELAGLYAAGCRIFTDDGADTLRPDVFLHAFEFLSMLPGARALIHTEVPELAHGVMHEGEVSARLGQPGIHHLSEDIASARAILTALSARCPVLITHIASGVGTLPLLRFGKARAEQLGLPGLVAGDCTFNHLLLTDEAVERHGTAAKINPPFRSEADRLALLEAVADGTLDALVTDHAPHTNDEKSQELAAAPFGCVGFELMLGLLLGHVAGTETPAGEITVERLLSLMTSGPAGILGVGASLDSPSSSAGKAGQDPPLQSQLSPAALSDFQPVQIETSPGRIAEGQRADLCLIDPEARWTIDPRQLVGKSKNTPFGGWEAKGRVLMTVCGGRVTHDTL